MSAYKQKKTKLINRLKTKEQDKFDKQVNNKTQKKTQKKMRRN